MVLMAAEVSRVSHMAEAYGSVPYGTDVSKWPAKWFDLIQLAEVEEWKVEEVREKISKVG